MPGCGQQSEQRPKPKRDREEHKKLASHDHLKEGQSTDIEMTSFQRENPLRPQSALVNTNFDLDEGEDPVGRYGYGIQSYFNLIRQLCYFMVVLTLLHIPLFIVYGQGTVVTDGGYAAYTLGNLGASATKCTQIELAANDFIMNCSPGTTIGSITHFGVFQDESHADQEGRCVTDRSDTQQTACLHYSDTISPLYSTKLAPCVGKSSCFVSKVHDAMTDAKCNTKIGSTLYVQYKCTQTQD